MATQVKHRRGTQSEIDAFTGAIAEIVVNTTEEELVLGNGATPGGVPIPKKKHTVLNFDTLNDAVINTSLKVGYTINLKERSTGNGGGGFWDVVLASSVTPNTFNIVQCTGVVSLALVLRVQNIVSVKQCGALGDGVTDDTDAVQAVMTAAENKTVRIDDGNYLITSQVDLPDNIEFICDGRFTLTGDEDFWFYAAPSCERIIVHSFIAEVTLAFASRTQLNRVLRIEEPEYCEVKTATITGASTAIHCLGGDDFVCGEIILFNTYGTAAQYGYGVNTSAKRITIDSIRAINDSSDDGRHALYINGSGSYLPEFAHVNSIYVKKWSANPVNIAITSADATYITIDSATLIETNMTPTASSTGAIHCGDESDNVGLYVGTLIYNGGAGTAFGNQSASSKGVTLENLIANNLPVAANASTALVYCRFTQDVQIKNINCAGLNTDWLAALYYRQVDNASFDSVYVGGSLGDQAVRLVDSPVLVGNIQTESIDRKFVSGATESYKQLQQKYSYGGAAPTSGTWERGDIVWDTTPSDGQFIGWVCTASGSPGTWKTWGVISA